MEGRRDFCRFDLYASAPLRLCFNSLKTILTIFLNY